MRGLARDPADRWPSMQAMLDALESPPVPARPRRRGWLIPAIAAGALGTALATWAAVGHDSRPPAPAPAPAPAVVPVAAVDLLPDLAPDRRAHWNVVGELPTIDALAHAWAPDATLAAILASEVRADGTADVGARTLQYIYVSPARAASRDPDVAGTCRHAFNFLSGTLQPYDWPGWDCANLPAVGAPRCTIREIWTRAIADGADPMRPAAIQLVSGWSFQQNAVSLHYDDDGATAAVPTDHLTHWDVLADRAPIDARARAWAPDAVLQSLVTNGVRADGTADLTAGAFVQYSYLSPARAASDDLKIGDLCMQTMWWKNGELSQYDIGSSNCAEMRAPPPPRCTFVEIWRRARADGADPARPASITWEPSMKGTGATWQVATKTFGKTYPDDC
jgi:hypothetical protein